MNRDITPFKRNVSYPTVFLQSDWIGSLDLISRFVTDSLCTVAYRGPAKLIMGKYKINVPLIIMSKACFTFNYATRNMKYLLLKEIVN